MKKILFAFWILAIFVACTKTEVEIKKVDIPITDSSDTHD
jgi:hypothetical protein